MSVVDRMFSEPTARRLARVHQLARYASGASCRRPDFLIIGAQKGGTSSLYAYLAQHPSIVPAVRKEVHFFENPGARARGERWYRSFFPTEFYLGVKERQLGAPVLTGEATTYMPYPRIPGQLHEVNPDAKLIFLLRNPVERALSQYMHVRRSYPGAEPYSFGDAIRSEAQRIQPDIEAKAADEWHDDVTFRAFSYVRSGMYAEQLKWWLTYFPQENVFVDLSERFFEDPDAVLRDVCAFLDLPAYDFDVVQQHNVGGYQDQVGAEDREFLVSSFAADRAELQRMLGADFGAHWF